MPLRTDQGYYSVPLTAVNVEGNMVSTELGITNVDSGTTYTFMGSEPYHALRAAIERHCDHGCGGAQLIGLDCWYLPAGQAGLSQFPHIDLIFENVTVPWIPGGYLYR